MFIIQPMFKYQVYFLNEIGISISKNYSLISLQVLEFFTRKNDVLKLNIQIIVKNRSNLKVWDGRVVCFILNKHQSAV